MKKTIAICTDIESFNKNRVFDISYAEKFVGAGIMPELYKYFTLKDFIVVTGDVALEQIKNGIIFPQDVLIISDMHASHGLQLLRSGSRPLLSICLESPIIAVDFYDDLFFGRVFYENYYILADTLAFHKASLTAKLTRIDFPSLSMDQIQKRETLLHPNNQKVSFIGANKWINYKRPTFFRGWKPLEILKGIYLNYRFFKSQSRSMQTTIDLHEKRFTLIKHLIKDHQLTIAGHGWCDEASYVENHKDWARFFKGYPSYKGMIDDKLTFLSNYRFSLCCENASYPGYVTEKIIHCLYAGTIPLYLGAPDIQKQIDSRLYIDISHLNLNDLDQVLCNEDLLKEKYSLFKKINHDFFYQYSYSFFAKKVLDLFLENEC